MLKGPTARKWHKTTTPINGSQCDRWTKHTRIIISFITDGPQHAQKQKFHPNYTYHRLSDMEDMLR